MKLFLSILSGTLIGLCFPEHNLSWLIFIALVPSFIVFYLESNWKKKIQYFWITGFLSCLIGFTWIIETGVVFGHIPYPIALVSYTLYSIIVGLYYPFMFLLPWYLTRNWIKAPSWFFLCAGMTFLEYWIPKMFLWTFGNLAFKNLLFIQGADLVGSFGLSYFVILTNFLIVSFFLSYFKLSECSFKKERLAAFVVILTLHGYGLYRYLTISKQIENSNRNMVVGAIQPNLSLKNLASNKRLSRREKYQNFLGMIEKTRELKKQNRKISLIVWPESTFGFVYDRDSLIQRDLMRLVGDIRVDLIFTTFSIEEEKIEVEKLEYDNQKKDTEESIEGDVEGGTEENTIEKVFSSSYIIAPDGEIKSRYHKLYLIPFGERIPFADTFPAFQKFLESFVDNISNFSAGSEYTLLPSQGRYKIASTICMDVLDPVNIRGFALEGAEFLINQANFAWFGKEGASGSVLQLIRFRGIENRIPTLLVSNSGRSVFMDAMGNYKTKITDMFVKDNLISEVKIVSLFSLFRLIGDVFIWCLGVWFILSLVVGYKEGWRELFGRFRRQGN